MSNPEKPFTVPKTLQQVFKINDQFGGLILAHMQFGEQLEVWLAFGMNKNSRT